MKLAFIPDSSLMQAALILAKEAYDAGEVPVGAIVEKDGQIIGSGRNRREEGKNALYHAEILAIEQACQTLHSWRLSDCKIYVTLEPCAMCMGAILNARIDTVVYGTDDMAAGCCGSAADLSKLQNYAYPSVYRGFLEEESRALLAHFFDGLRSQ